MNKECFNCKTNACINNQENGKDFCCWCLSPIYIKKSPIAYFCEPCKESKGKNSIMFI